MIVNSGIYDNLDCLSQRSSFNGSVNKLIGTYGGLQYPVISQLFKSYCCSFYGSQLWNFSSSGFNACCIQWNKAIRLIFNLPYQTHTWLLGPIWGQFHISVQLYVKSLRFMHYMLNSSNRIVSYVGKIARSSASTPLGRNM